MNAVERAANDFRAAIEDVQRRGRESLSAQHAAREADEALQHAEERAQAARLALVRASGAPLDSYGHVLP